MTQGATWYETGPNRSSPGDIILHQNDRQLHWPACPTPKSDLSLTTKCDQI